AASLARCLSPVCRAVNRTCIGRTAFIAPGMRLTFITKSGERVLIDFSAGSKGKGIQNDEFRRPHISGKVRPHKVPKLLRESRESIRINFVSRIKQDRGSEPFY